MLVVLVVLVVVGLDEVVVVVLVVVAVVVVGGLAVTTMSNPNPSCIELELGSGFDKIFWSPNSFWTKCIENIFLQKMSF